MSVQAWLDSLSLVQYCTQFVAHGYDTLARCAALTSAELDVIGVTRPGHKKRLLANIRNIQDEPQLAGHPAKVQDKLLGVGANNMEVNGEPLLPSAHLLNFHDEPQSASHFVTVSDNYSPSDAVSTMSQRSLIGAGGHENFDNMAAISNVNSCEDDHSIYANVATSRTQQAVKQYPIKKQPVPTPRKNIPPKKFDLSARISQDHGLSDTVSLSEEYNQPSANTDKQNCVIQLAGVTRTFSSTDDSAAGNKSKSSGNVDVPCDNGLNNVQLNRELSHRNPTNNALSGMYGDVFNDASSDTSLVSGTQSVGVVVGRSYSVGNSTWYYDTGTTGSDDRDHRVSDPHDDAEQDVQGQLSSVTVETPRPSSYFKIWNCSSAARTVDAEGLSIDSIGANREVINSSSSLSSSPSSPRGNELSDMFSPHFSQTPQNASLNVVDPQSHVPFPAPLLRKQTSLDTAGRGYPKTSPDKQFPKPATPLRVSSYKRSELSATSPSDTAALSADNNLLTGCQQAPGPPMVPSRNSAQASSSSPGRSVLLLAHGHLNRAVDSDNHVYSEAPLRVAPPPPHRAAPSPPRAAGAPSDPANNVLKRLISVGGVCVMGPAASHVKHQHSVDPSSLPQLHSIHKHCDSSDDDTPIMDSSDDNLSDGGQFYNDTEFRCPASLTRAIPVVKSPQTRSKFLEKKGYLFKLESESGSTPRLSLPWQRLWVTFDRVSFKYYASEKSLVSRRVIPVRVMVNVETDIRSTDVSHNCRFKLSTIDRVYTFAADSGDEVSLWTSMIMQAIIESKTSVEDFVDGGDMNTPDEQGFVRMERVKGKLYLAMKQSQLCYYKSIEDFKGATPVHQIDMQTASVKELGKCSIQLYTPYSAFVFIFETQEETTKWMDALEDGICRSLGDEKILNEVYKNVSNRLCADCEQRDPDWASITFCITLCRNCAGIHRSMPKFKVRSLRMDSKVWTPCVVQLMINIGNENANDFWEWSLPKDDKISPKSTQSDRKQFIYRKYRDRAYAHLDILHTDQTTLNEALCKSAQFENVLETMRLLFSGADIHHRSSLHNLDIRTPLELATNAVQMLQMEFLRINGGELQRLETESETGSPKKDVGVVHSGFLMKTGSNTRGDFLKRWIVLDSGKLSYYDNEKSSTANDTIERSEMLSISVVNDDRMEFTFELATRKQSGRTFLFAAETLEDRRKWILKLAQTIAALSTSEVGELGAEFCRGGCVYCRIGATAEWNFRWIHLEGSTLYVNNKGRELEEFDLRKAKSLAFVQQPEQCHEVLGNGQSLVIDMPNGKALYIQSDFRKETNVWYYVLQKALQSVANALSSQPLTGDNVPLLVDKCINFLATYGLQVEGIHRKDGQHSVVSRLLEQFTADARSIVLKPDYYQVPEVSSVLRRFIRNLEEPLLVERLRDRWLQAAVIDDTCGRLDCYKELLHQLPVVNYCTVKRLIAHLARVAEFRADNKMSAANLAQIFGRILMNVDKPSSVKGRNNFTYTKVEINLVRELIENHQQLFEIRNEELEQEKKIEEAVKKIERLMSVKSSPSFTNEIQDLVIDVHIGCRGGELISCRVSQSVRAHELLTVILDQAILDSRAACWTLFEVTCEGRIERPLHSMEIVLNVILKWSSWPVDFRRASYLCLKHNYVYEKISLISQHMFLSGELRLADKRSYRKLNFEFRQLSLSYYSAKAAPPVTWKVEDLTIYVGLQRNRNPPTKWGFTFYSSADQLVSPFFGHSICCNSEDEMYQWVGIMIKAQHPEGLLPNGPNGAPHVQPCTLQLPQPSCRSRVDSTEDERNTETPPAATATGRHLWPKLKQILNKKQPPS